MLLIGAKSIENRKRTRMKQNSSQNASSVCGDAALAPNPSHFGRVRWPAGMGGVGLILKACADLIQIAGAGASELRSSANDGKRSPFRYPAPQLAEPGFFMA
jgi:hypothetical protein